MSIIDSSFIRKSVDQRIPFLNSLKVIADDMNAEFYIIGGTVRDILLGNDTIDIDIVPFNVDYILFAKKFAKKINAFAIEFKENVSIIDKKSKIHLADISAPRGVDVYEDILLRDFTINNLAIDSEYNLIGDYTDIENNIIRKVSDKTFTDDPLRILRAFRFQSKYGFMIEDTTMKNLTDNITRLKESAGERVNSEICKIIDGEHFTISLQTIVDNNLFISLKELYFADEYNSFWRKVEQYITQMKKSSNDYINDNRLDILMVLMLNYKVAGIVIDYLKLSNSSKKFVNNMFKVIDEFKRIATDNDYKKFCYRIYDKYDIVMYIFKLLAFDNGKLNIIDELHGKIDISKAELISGDTLLNEGIKPSAEFKIILEDLKILLSFNEIDIEGVSEYLKDISR